MLHADPALKPGQAIEQVAKKIGGRDWKKIWERLRKRWPKLEKNGQLPPPQTEDALQQQIAERIGAIYDQREAARNIARREVAAKEQAVESSFGIQVRDRNASHLLRDLEMEKERLSGIIHQPVDQVVSYYEREGIDRDDAIARHLRYRKNYLEIDKVIAAVREIRDLRAKAGMG